MIAQSFQGIDVKGFNDAVHKKGAVGDGWWGVVVCIIIPLQSGC
jgi:hypothetical protein